jgi:peptidoglycan/xylan/chitin deacetylase (PgdA/CDA1 family)
MKKIVYLDLDDFGETNNRLDWLWMLKKEFPNFKINLFTIPNDFHGFFLEYVKSLDWIQLCVHGNNHVNNEEISEHTLQDLARCFTPIYRAPFWQLSDTMYKRLKKLGYKIMIHPDDPRQGIKFNWNIKDSPPPLDIIYGHGHIQDVCENGLVESFDNIMKLPKDTEFRFL